MFRNYLITALRTLTRQRSTTLLNIAGLTLGITCSLILFLLVRHISSFDKFHSKIDRIYRVVTESEGSNGRFYTSGIPSVLPDAFRNDFPEAEQVTFVSYRSGVMISIPQRSGESRKFNEDRGVTFAEPTFFDVFDRKILVGNASKGLDEPNEAIISKSLAQKYFGREDAVGEILKYDTLEYKVTAVMEDAPSNTDLPFNLMLSYVTIKANQEKNGWNSIWSDEQCYILLQDKEQASSIMSRMPAFVEKYLGKENYSKQTFNLQPVSQMHFDDRYSTLSYNTVPKEMLLALSIVALFLLVTACINFINLSTAEAIKRSKEVGIRKSLGSTRGQLVTQFLGETTLITAFSMIVSLSLAQLALSFINVFLETNLTMDFSSDVSLWAFIIVVTVVVSLLSGLYPSFVVSGFRPAVALKNLVNSRSSSGYNLRRGLVVLQFVISQFFIFGTIVLISQMKYLQTKELGFRQDAIIILPVPESGAKGSSINTKSKTLRNEISRINGVQGVSLSSTPPSSGSVSGTGFIFEGEDASARKNTQVKQVDGSYIDLYNLQLIAGTGLEDRDTISGFVVNEQLVKVSGLENPADIVGKKITVWGRTLPVLGVVKNFHTVSLETEIQPTLLMNRVNGYETLSLVVNPSDYQATIEKVKSKWEEMYPDHIFSYEFLDEHIREFYEGEQRMSVLFTVFTSIAIFIGCLGLFGLATFMVNQKTKEVGVRKVLGASVESILVLFSKEYVKLITIAFVIASPFGWYLMNRWLEQFAYKITIGPSTFVIGFAVTLAIAIFTVGYRSMKAAIANPVKSLKCE